MPVGRIKDRLYKTQRAGIIRLGYKVATQNGKKRPDDADHFNLNEAPELKTIYGEHPQSLDILFTSDDEDVVASNYLQMYRCDNPHEENKALRRTHLACIGEGEVPETGAPTLANWLDVTKAPNQGLVEVTEQLRQEWMGELEQIRRDLADPAVTLESPFYMKRRVLTLDSWLSGRSRPRYCHQKYCPDYLAKNCKEILTLTFKVLRGPHIFGEYQLRTSSKNGMRQVFNCLDDAKKLIQRYRPDLPYGKISGIPFRLFRHQQQINVPDANGRMGKKTKWILRMEVNPQFSQFFAKQLQAEVSRLLLEPAPEDTVPSADLAGASPHMTVCPEELYPTPEEVQEAQAHEEAQARRNEDWLQDPEAQQLIQTWQQRSGKLISEGKLRAIVKNYQTIDEFKEAIRRNLQ